MTHRLTSLMLVAIAVSFGACAHLDNGTSRHPPTPDRPTALRLDAIRQARVWTATDVASMDMLAGPAGPGAFPPDAVVACDYVDKKMTGSTPKFACIVPPDDELKVKYGQDNGEVYAEVAASRLLWALGFGADRVYPVRVVCRGCPSRIHGTDIASVERRMPGREIETAPGSGWTWPELDLIGPDPDGAKRAERDALKLLAVFVQHSDSKGEQQRLLCLGQHGKTQADDACAESFMMVHDLGQTFGRANRFNRQKVSSVNLPEWSRAHIWKHPERCVANLPKSMTGTLDDPTISEAGRRFLADLLVQLTDIQLRDLFTVARFPLRSEGTTTVDQWVETFKRKRDDIVNHTCPN